MIRKKLDKLGVAWRLRRALWEQVRAQLSDHEWMAEHAPFLSEVTPEELLGRVANLQWITPSFQNGNVSPMELLVISALVAARKPGISLEIGTFDGNTTLQIAANAADDGRVVTLDLPLEQVEEPGQIAPDDIQFIRAAARQVRKFVGSSYAGRIVELFGDSKTFDFKGALCEGGAVDLAFIDGSHSYEYVKSDTERLLPLLGGDAVVIWHDYCRSWPGVVKYLNELGRSMPLRLVTGTTVVYLDCRNA